MSGDEHRTPPALFKELDSVFNFFWDACCNKENCLVKQQKTYLALGWGNDYLTIDLTETRYKVFRQVGGSIFMNPPYSRKLIGPMMRKAWDDSKYFRIVCLVKADMSTKWFNDILQESSYLPVQINQQHMALVGAMKQVVGRMEDQYTKSDIGILHLRNRIKFLQPDGTASKSGANFPSMIMVIDRRGKSK